MSFLEEYAKRRYEQRNGPGNPTTAQMLIDSISHLVQSIIKLGQARK